MTQIREDSKRDTNSFQRNRWNAKYYVSAIYYGYQSEVVVYGQPIKHEWRYAILWILYFTPQLKNSQYDS